MEITNWVVFIFIVTQKVLRGKTNLSHSGILLKATQKA
jgi:hypothetical protein